MNPTDPVRAFLDDHEQDLLDELRDWVRIPSVSSEPEREMDVLRSANWLVGRLRDIGFPVVERWGTEGGPAVYACWDVDPDAPTVLVYSHHDVRAVRAATWGESAPFEPQGRDGRVYGRGTSDAKGQVLVHLWGLRAHLLQSGGRPAVNLRLLVEGEEEVGSPHLAALLADRRERVAADLVVLSDTMLWTLDAPAICTGVRGMVSAHLEVRGPSRDVHSGAVAGVAPNPCMELCRLLAQLHDDKGRVTLPGFYDAVEEISAEEREALAALPYSDEDWLSRTETGTVGGEHGYTALERVWVRPSAEVLTLIGGDPIGASRGAVPSIAQADLSIRTAPAQKVADVAEQLRQWIDERISDKVDYELTVSEESGQEPYRTPGDTPALRALEAAMAKGFAATQVGRMRNGGGAPASLLADVTGAPVVFFGTGLPEDHWHDSDEKVEVEALLKGAATMGHFWSELAAVHQQRGG
jgi:acetylornithine deacetylase/succinyl-diaminopimelate desuccinylase-like protein